MVQRGWGRVVMISSVNARIGRGTNTAYITAKAALEGLTRGRALEEVEHLFAIRIAVLRRLERRRRRAARSKRGRVRPTPRAAL
jgi:NADP-dependent 3-hydroxy acid dehydrogenase YdfG